VATLGPLATRTRVIIAMIKAIGLCSPTLDESVFKDIAKDFVKLDLEAYARIFRVLGEHDADDVLPSIAVPVLVMTGEKDLFTPLETSKRIVSKVPGAELCVVQGGTHYTPIEYPMIVNLRIERFIKERLGLPEDPNPKAPTTTARATRKSGRPRRQA